MLYLVNPWGLLVYPIVLGGGDPDDEVGPEAECPAEQGEEEDDADHRGIDIQILGQTATDAGNAAVGGGAGQTTVTVVVFHMVCFLLESPRNP